MRNAIRFAKQRYWASLLIMFLGPGVLTDVALYFWTGGFPVWQHVVAAIVGGSLAAILFLIVKLPEPGYENEPLASSQLPVQLPVERFPLNRICQLTPEELVSEISGRTSIQAKQIVDSRIGLFLTVSGIIHNVEDGVRSGKLNVVAHRDASDVLLILDFDKNYWGQMFGTLMIGSPISAIGTIGSISATLGGTVALTDCELRN